MISILPWILIMIILGVIGYFMTQQYRDMQHALQEMDLRLQQEALRTHELEGQLQDLEEALTEKWAALEEAPSGHPSNLGMWKLTSIPEDDDSDIETLPVEEVVDDLLSKLEDHVALSESK